MNSTPRRKALVILAALTLTLLAIQLVLAQQRSLLNATPPTPPPLPNPVLYFIGQEPYTANGKQWMRYKFAIENFSAYPDELFAAAPELPPCGKNTKASRTWVDIYDQGGKRLYGFCALGKNTGLNEIWFALEQDVIPPSWVYVEFNDRKTSTKYKSNLADTTN
ncbi:MAG: hypothetical protein QOH25_535 [Acidobacteriota bacterium]|jgi:hypothetical protein|nr:hypothetical protein [Acidobacteriota bacterium]